MEIIITLICLKLYLILQLRYPDHCLFYYDRSNYDQLSLMIYFVFHVHMTVDYAIGEL